MLHPDRFDQTRQRAEWEHANEMLQELNDAYEVLGDAESRARYDRKHSGATTQPSAQETHSRYAPPPTSTQQQSSARSAQPPPPKQAPPPSPRQPFDLSHIKSGTGCFDSFPISVQRRLTSRVAGGKISQCAFRFATIGPRYFFALLLGCWFFVLYGEAYVKLWSDWTFGCLVGVTGVVAILQAFNVGVLMRWHTTPLQCWVFVTPLYFIKTQYDEVWYWPLWEITDIKATHGYLNGIYQGTELHVEFGSSSEKLTIWPKTAYSSMISTIHTFKEKLQRAQSQYDWSYFVDNNDFREFHSIGQPRRLRRPLLGKIEIFILLIYGISFAIVAYINSHQPYRSPPSRASHIFQSKPPTFSQPEIPFPSNGQIYTFSRREGVYPLELKTPYGGNYVVKITETSTGIDMLTVFVHGGQTVNLKVPLGSYIVKYAAGEKWYGHDHLFGPATSYSKIFQTFTFADETLGYSITFSKVRNGNLETKAISPNEF